jgi:predicted transporter
MKMFLLLSVAFGCYLIGDSLGLSGTDLFFFSGGLFIVTINAVSLVRHQDPPEVKE